MDFRSPGQQSRVGSYTRDVLGLFSELEAEPTPAPSGYLRVAVERAVDAYPSGLVYGIPPGMEGLGPGERVRVPLGRSSKLVAGTVIEVVEDPSKEGLDPGTNPQRCRP